MVLLEELDYLLVHITELAAVALIEDKNHVLVQNRMLWILRDKIIEFLDGGHDNLVLVGIPLCILILKLSLQNLGVPVAIGCSTLEPVILLHGLIVEVFSIDHKQNLIYIRQSGCKLCSLKGSKGLATSCGMPDVTASSYLTHLLVVGRNLNAV